LARPQKAGLEYFPLDVDIDSDERVEFILAKHGFQAFGILIKLLMEIYRQGYYIAWTERQQYVFAKRVNVDSMYTETVVSAYINEGIFDKNLFDQYGILTSHGVQARYLQASGRRVTVEMIEQFCLLDTKELPKQPKISFIDVSACKNPSFCIRNVYGNPSKRNITLAESTQSKVKESNISTTTTPLYSPIEEKEPMMDEELARVVKEFSDNIHPITPMEFEALQEELETFSPDRVIEAIARAVDRGKRSMGYIRGILKSWQEEGYDEPGDVKGNEKPERSKKTNGRRFSSPRKRNREQEEESESARKLDADLEYYETHQVYPWEVQSGGDGAGGQPGQNSRD